MKPKRNDPVLVPITAAERENTLNNMRKNTRTMRDELNAALRVALADILNRKTADLAPAVVDVIRPWTEEANIEALVEWLGKGGWDKVDGDKVEARLVAAARAVAAAKKWPYLSVYVWTAPDAAVHTVYSTARNDPDLEAVKGIAYTGKGHWAEDYFFYIQFTEAMVDARLENTLPANVTVFVGLDALKFALEHYYWPGPNICLTDKAGKDGDWLRLLAGDWLKDRADRETERHNRDALAVGISIRYKARTDAGNEWTPLPRALDVAAALGGPFSVDVDGETYTPEPDLAGAAVGRTLRLRGLDIVPAAWLGNDAQMSLALDLAAPLEAVREYMIETATRTAHLAQLPNMCPKLLGFMFAAAPMTGRPVKGTLLDLARWLYPDWKERRQSKRDLQGLGAAFVAIKGLRLVETKPDGTRHPYDLFTVDYDLSCKPDAALGFMVNPWLVERMKGGKGGGFFLLNMTRWLALGIQNPRLFPLALRLAALWDTARNGGIYEPARLRPIEADRLAWECNTLPEGAAMYRAGKTDTGTGKTALAVARAHLEADLDALREAGLLGPWTKRKVHGRGFELLPVPPADYAEACKRAAQVIRKRGHRPTRKA